MIMDIRYQLEEFLLQAGGWVQIPAICVRFAIDERQLRAVGRLPSLLDGFAVTGSKGAIHHEFLSNDEFAKLERSLGRHAISELRRRKRWRQARQGRVKREHGLTWESHTHQGVMLL